MGFSYTITYKKGKDNAATYTLSRRPSEGECGGQLLSFVSLYMTIWIERLKEENLLDMWLQEIRTNLGMTNCDHRFNEKDGVIMFNGRYCIGPTSKLKDNILIKLHCTLVGGYGRYYQTLQQIKKIFYWKGITCLVKEFVDYGTTIKALRLLQSLPILIAV